MTERDARRATASAKRASRRASRAHGTSSAGAGETVSEKAPQSAAEAQAAYEHRHAPMWSSRRVAELFQQQDEEEQQEAEDGERDARGVQASSCDRGAIGGLLPVITEAPSRTPGAVTNLV